MYQCLQLPDKVFIFSKTAGNKRLIKKGTAIETYLKIRGYPDYVLSLIMAIIGDGGDNVDGVHGIGPKRVQEFLPQLVRMCGSMEQIRKNIQTESCFSDLKPTEEMNKYLKKVIDMEISERLISKNLRLVDYEVISRYIDNPDKTEIIDKRKKLLSVIENKNVVPIKLLKPALELNKIHVDDDLDIIYGENMFDA
jgi:5'-3' exonuclease